MTRKKITIAVNALILVFRQKKYLFRTLIYSVLMIFIILWLFNLPLLFSIASTDWRFLLPTLADSFSGVFIYIDDIVPLGILIIAFLQGLLLAQISFSVDYKKIKKRSKKDDKKTKNQKLSLGAGLGFGVIGTSCLSCGGMVIAPLLSGFFGPLSVVGAKIFSITFLLVSVLIICYGLYRIGLNNAKIIDRIMMKR